MSYIKATGICLKNEIAAIKKKGDVALHPIFEALTNSFEDIRERFGYDGCAKVLFRYSVDDLVL